LGSLAEQRILVSLANIITSAMLPISNGKSFIKMLNNRGPNTEPYRNLTNCRAYIFKLHQSRGLAGHSE
jgi:hypothetical protein